MRELIADMKPVWNIAFCAVLLSFYDAKFYYIQFRIVILVLDIITNLGAAIQYQHILSRHL